MRFGFTVGENEQHQIESSFDQCSGDLRILVDGDPVLADIATLTPDPVKRYELVVGKGEQHRLAFTVSYASDPDLDGVQANARLMVSILQ